MSDRRETLKIIGAIGVTCAFPYGADELYGQHVHPEGEQAAAAPPRFFKPDEMKVISRVADLIIPATDTPGAVGAGVPLYIDLVVSTNKTHQKTFRDGLAWLERKKFMELSEAGQIGLLEPLCEAVDQQSRDGVDVEFFRAMKGMTADGYYTSKAGMNLELGFTGGAVLAEYPECIHEH
jgi:gluconate 2-dehydrogenase gamma chain